MNFKDYIKNAKSIQSTDPKKVADEFKENFSLMASEEDVVEMTDLIVHVCGEQLGEWKRGLDLLKKIKNNAKVSDKTHMARAVGILSLGNNPNLSIEHFSLSEQVKIYTATAAALTKLGGIKNAEKFLKKANELKAIPFPTIG
jgi:hypothetical protein